MEIKCSFFKVILSASI